jgi:hypothetical protein
MVVRVVDVVGQHRTTQRHHVFAARDHRGHLQEEVNIKICVESLPE